MKPIKVVISGQNALGSTFASAEKSIGGLGAKLSKFGKIGGGFGLGGIAAGIGSSFALGLQNIPGELLRLEDSLRHLQNVTKGMGDEQLPHLKKSILETSKATSLSTDETVKGYEALLNYGLSIDETSVVMQSLGRYSMDTGASIDQLSETAVAMLRQSKIPVSEISKAFDALSASEDAGAANLGEMVSKFPGMISGLKGMGFQGRMGVSSLAALVQIAKNVTNTTDDATSAVEGLVGGLASTRTLKKITSLPGFANILHEINKEAEAGRDPIEFFLNKFKKATEIMGLDTTQKSSLAGIIFGKESGRAVTELMGKMQEYATSRDALFNADPVVNKKYENRMKELNQQWKLLQKNITAKAEPGLAKVFKSINSFVMGINSNAEKAHNILKAIEVTVLGGGALLGFALMGKTVGFIVSGLADALKFARLIKLTNFAASPLGVAVGAAGLAYAGYQMQQAGEEKKNKSIKLLKDQTASKDLSINDAVARLASNQKNEAFVNIKFENAPPGTRTVTQSKGDMGLSVEHGRTLAIP